MFDPNAYKPVRLLNHLGGFLTFTRRLPVLICMALLCFALIPGTYAKGKDRVWHDGVLNDSSTERGTRVIPGQYGSLSLRDDVTLYQIDDGKTVYVVARTLRNRRDKALNVTINGHVQFAVDGSTCYLLDDDGKEHKLSVEKKIAK